MYKDQMDGNGKTGKTWLQAVGFQYAIVASELRIGDITIWNYGYTAELVEIVKETKSFIFVKERTSGKVYDRRLKKSTLVAVKKDVYNRVVA